MSFFKRLFGTKKEQPSEKQSPRPQPQPTKSVSSPPVRKAWIPEDGYVLWTYVALNSRTGWEKGGSYNDLFEAVDQFMEVQWERHNDTLDHVKAVRIAKAGDGPTDPRAVNTTWSSNSWWNDIAEKYDLFDSIYSVSPVRAYFFRGGDHLRGDLKTEEEKRAWFKARTGRP